MSAGRAISGAARAIGAGLGDLLAPPSCAGCGEPIPRRRAFCEECELALLECDPARCAGCGAEGSRQGLCRACRLRLRPLAGVFCGFTYEGPLREALQAFKYQGRDDLGPLLAARWVEALSPPRRLLSRSPLVAPVPLHVRRLRRRGYDQAWLLARVLARRLRLTPEARLLCRVRETRAQVGLSRPDREKNVRGAFVALPAAGRPVLLVDDVFTTGATMKAAAEALRRAGSGPVYGFAVAQALE